MTLTGQTNHYKIKFLSGYGFALRSNDKQIILQEGRDARTGQAGFAEAYRLNVIPYDKIVISGKGYVAIETLRLLARYNVTVTILDSFGNLVSSIGKTMSSNIATKNRMAQYDTFRNAEQVRYLQNQIMKAKLESDIKLLQEFHLDSKPLQRYLAQVDGKQDKRQLLTIESRAGNIYWRQYAKLIDTKHHFVSRRGGGLAMSKAQASDITNALINYGTSVLASEITKQVNAYGLDSYLGFYHKEDTSFQALTWDVIEPFRVLVESTVAKFAGPTNHNHTIRKREYTWTSECAVIMSQALIKRYLEALSRTLESERLYSFKHGLKRRDGLSMCRESTIIRIAVERLVNYCRGHAATFEI